LQKKTGELTSRDASVCIDAVKWLALPLLVVLFAAANSCTTLVNRRDLYSPEPAPDSLEAMRQMTTVTTTTTRIRRDEIAPAGY
jgi:acyl-coenzyme A synthetase/AMP-(fatty) acid ligase